MKAMIFSAGFGKRLLPITANIPKALVTIKRRPILDWIIKFLIQSGIDEIIINTHYLADQVESFIHRKKYKIPITCIYESELLGTGGGLYNTRKKWGQDNIYICNVYILCDFDLKTFFLITMSRVQVYMKLKFYKIKVTNNYFIMIIIIKNVQGDCSKQKSILWFLECLK